MITNRNDYIDGEIALAKERGYDIVQLKLDGWWCRTVCNPHQTEFYSETGRLFDTMNPCQLDGTVLIGEFMRGTQWSQHQSRTGKYFVYDIWSAYGKPLTTETYLRRYQMLCKLKLPSLFQVVQCFHISDAEAVWQRFVMSEGYEGIVFRRSVSPMDDVIMRCKREYTLDGIVVGFEPGLGKHDGRLGALRVQMASGATTNVGTGFTDDERQAIWDNQLNWLGKTIEFTANAVFESGNVRHARFVRRRDDKA